MTPVMFMWCLRTHLLKTAIYEHKLQKYASIILWNWAFGAGNDFFCISGDHDTPHSFHKNQFLTTYQPLFLPIPPFLYSPNSNLANSCATTSAKRFFSNRPTL